MSIITRTYKALPKVTMAVQRAVVLVDLKDYILFGRWLQLANIPRHLCTIRAEDKQIPYSGKSLAQTKEKQGWRYDPTIKYKASRPSDIPLCWFYSSDSDSETNTKPPPKDDVYKFVNLSDWTDSETETETENETETETETEHEVEDILMTEEEAQAQIDKLFAGTKKEELYRYNPNIKYEPLKRYDVPRFAFSDDDSTNGPGSLESDTEAGTLRDVEI
ncbi:hypothetical protein POM88_035653 [Heracleum sosnowskyi]|uniref:Uncharacterized protein n=1 Tax=Heracleum sosnowskyi TaxID=360622 RepID=A0AAD8HLZ5_9APIA|nr:hypothetical protein POM88_035653 [Heracleum sosnowskyi]